MRCIALVDLDCFYAQVEAKRRHIDSSKVPVAVQQWTAVIAVNYKAKREFGVSRSDTVADVQRKCPQIRLCHVDVVDGDGNVLDNPEPSQRYSTKVTLARYRDESHKIGLIFRRFSPLVERASIDESYLDLSDAAAFLLALHEDPNKPTPSNLRKREAALRQVRLKFLPDGSPAFSGSVCVRPEEQHPSARTRHTDLMAVASQLVEHIRATVCAELGYTCSAGVAHCRKIAKAVASWEKPNGQTVVPPGSVQSVMDDMHITDVQGFGGKWGATVCAELGLQKFGQVRQKFASLDALTESMQNRRLRGATFLWQMAHGIDEEPVKCVDSTRRFCSTTNLRRGGVSDMSELAKVMRPLCAELVLRLDTDRKRYKRIPQQLILMGNTSTQRHTKTCALPHSLLNSRASLTKRIDQVHRLAMKEFSKQPGAFRSVGVGLAAFVPQNRDIRSFFSRPPSTDIEEVQDDAESANHVENDTEPQKQRTTSERAALQSENKPHDPQPSEEEKQNRTDTDTQEAEAQQAENNKQEEEDVRVLERIAQRIYELDDSELDAALQHFFAQPRSVIS